MVYELVKELPEERIQKILNETKDIRKLRDVETLKDDAFLENFKDEWRYIVVDRASDHFLMFISPEPVFDLTFARYLFCFQNHYYFFSTNYNKDKDEIEVKFYKENPPPENLHVFQMLVDDLKQAFICGDWSLEGMKFIFNETRKEELNRRTNEILNMGISKFFDDTTETNEMPN